MKKITIIIAILLIASVGFLIKYQSDNEKLKTDNIKLTKKVEKVGAQYNDTKKELSALKSNNQQQVKEAAERFLKAFRTYDTGKGESYLANIDAYITPNAKKELTPPGGPTQSAPGAGDEKEKKKVSFQSEYTGGELYYAFLDTTKANVLAKVKSKISVNGVSSDNMSLMQINLIYDGNKKLWLVDKLIPLADLRDQMP
ncbi:hypothetical protein CN637_22180 [Bacillus toyonensis]|uniref:hypothetical protein n=1 Tax=Bacillus toyonensis TaxID=155322 RepID=UPI0001A078B0|nr:hypothetical protein [Bacillus toyonensis]EEL19420.1 hypothetical protein bcere0017_58330 [Bacillus cereus Rock1-3]KAB2403819.1 hypothetical protein F8514_25135 [Bacillus toyonensis]PEL67132.1 hypothetical protein CN637_22180 [Bacillus toyonensis]PHE43648.1 hypothetical protein COF71_26505 [Bacillus toyonensis]PHF15867.1 hypothetical protein COF83_13290 [Bacillus toyonensis]